METDTDSETFYLVVQHPHGQWVFEQKAPGSFQNWTDFVLNRLHTQGHVEFQPDKGVVQVLLRSDHHMLTFMTGEQFEAAQKRSMEAMARARAQGPGAPGQIIVPR